MKTNLLEQKSSLKKLAAAALLSAAICLPAAVYAQDGPPPPSRMDDEGGPPDDGPRLGGEQGRPQRGERMRKWLEERGGDEQTGKMGRAGRFLGFVSEFNKQVQDPVQSVGLAAVGVKEFYRREGKPEDAVPVIDEMLKMAKDQRVRNVLLFTMRQIYDEQKNGAKMLELSKQIMRENIAAVEKK